MFEPFKISAISESSFDFSSKGGKLQERKHVTNHSPWLIPAKSAWLQCLENAGWPGPSKVPKLFCSSNGMAIANWTNTPWPQVDYENKGE